MNFIFYKNQLYRGFCKGEVSVVEPADSADALKLNQITGSNLYMLFIKDTLSKLTVKGKAQSLNWIREAEGWKGTETIQSEEYQIWLQQGQVIRVTARPKTQGRMIPLMECNPENTILKNSKWQGHLRPKFR